MRTAGSREDGASHVMMTHEIDSTRSFCYRAAPMQSRRPSHRIGLILGLGFVLGAIIPGAASMGAGPAGRTILGLGYEYDLSGAREEFLLPDPLDDPSIASDHPLYVRIRAPWSLLESATGAYDWSEVDRIVEVYRAARYVIVLSLYGVNLAVDPAGRLPSAAAPGTLKAWLEFLRAAALHFRGLVQYYEIWDEPNREPGWGLAHVSDYAYLLKNSSVTIRSADPEARIVQGGVVLEEGSLESELAWQRSLYEQEIGTYVDVLAVQPGDGTDVRRILPRVYDLLLEHDPSAQLWVNEVPLEGENDRDRAAHLLAQFVAGQGEGASLVSFDLEADVEGRPEYPGVLLDIHKLFIPTYGLVYGAGIGFEPLSEDETGAIEGVVAYRFFDAETFQGLIGFWAPDPPSAGRARMVIDTAAVRGVAVYDIIGGRAGPVRDIRPDFDSNTTRAPVGLYERPQVLQYARVPIKGFEVEREELEIRETGIITAEEVMAEHQRFMTDQDFRLKHYRAQALLTYHGKIGGSNTLDISIDNAFFWDETTGAEWEQRALYYNGVLWKGKKLPELPIPQPEKVFTLPLDINLNKDYSYRYIGRETIGDYDCHVLDFEPIDPTMNLYKGRAWIETRTYAPVKTATVQTHLTSPLVSNEEKNYYTPHTGPDGTTYWLPSRIEGQQIFSVAGQNIVLLREIDFTELMINDAGFESSREEAYRSNRQMLRDTDRGLRYLERTETGDRVVREEMKRSALLGLVGVFRQPGLEFPVLPLAGAAYFNFDFRQRNIQMTALLGGVVNLFNLSNPEVFGKRLDASVQVVGLAVDVTDRLFIEGEEKEESNIDARTQSLSLGLGAALGNFMRVRLTYGLEYVNYSRDEDTESFVTPADTFIQLPGIEWEFNRAAWTVTASGQRGYRNTWEPWGDTTEPATDPRVIKEFPSSPCDSPGSCFSEFDPDRNDFDRYQFSVARQLFLPLFQKLRFEGMWQTGSRLDRFSQFQFSFFGNRLRGFSGSGVRYDRGAIARAQYAFNIANVIRFDASLDHAYVRDSLTSEDFRRFTGFGIAGNLMGPWETILQFDIGVAIQSDFEDLRGGTEFQIGLLKYF